MRLVPPLPAVVLARVVVADVEAQAAQAVRLAEAVVAQVVVEAPAVAVVPLR